MSVLINCPDCQAKLSVPDKLLGRRIKCSKCQAVFIVASESDAVTPQAPAPPPEPAYREDDRPSRRPRRDDYYDDDRPRRRRRRRRDDDDDDDDFYGRRGAPHRGGTIITLGILSIVLSCLPIIGFALGAGAVNMANNDLYQIDSGRMDPSGRGSTQTGQVCGYIGIGLSVLMFILGCVLRLSMLRGR